LRPGSSQRANIWAKSPSAIALLYGIDPQWFAKTFLGVSDLNVNFAHILRAIMCLYLALGCFWLFCALSDMHKNTAILTTMVFAGGLLIGRLLSFVVDGLPENGGKVPNELKA
jgi:hypothetical protein